MSLGIGLRCDQEVINAIIEKRERPKNGDFDDGVNHLYGRREAVVPAKKGGQFFVTPKAHDEATLKFAQEALSATPVIILGSGASAAHGVPGMWPLAQHLMKAAIPVDWTDGEGAEWDGFVAQLARDVDLESALQAIRPTERQTHFIAATTRAFLLPSDVAVLHALLADRWALPLSRLYRHLFDSTHPNVHVITPNYDRLAEYAADAADLSCFTGFGYGHLQSRAKHPNTRVTVNRREARTVSVWKVHGSLDWFQDVANQIVGVPSVVDVPTGYSPLMITPGIDKYRLTHGEPFRTILACSDNALENARAYFCVGYGFNDEHLQTKLVERCEKESTPLVIITKKLTPTAKAFLRGGRCRRYLAIEDGPAGGRGYMNDEPDGFDLDKPIWKLNDFLNHVIGGVA